jgi:hypothetical protein
MALELAALCFDQSSQSKRKREIGPGANPLAPPVGRGRGDGVGAALRSSRTVLVESDATPPAFPLNTGVGDIVGFLKLGLESLNRERLLTIGSAPLFVTVEHL